MNRLVWLIAWRHLRAQKPPTWLLGLTLRALYLAVVGGAFLVASAAAPRPGMFSAPPLTPPIDYLGALGSVTLAVGGLLLGFCVLARLFNLLATIIAFSVAQGCMALVLVLGLMGGLEDDLRGRLLDHRAHVRIARHDRAGFIADEALLASLRALPEVAGASALLEGEVLVRTAYGRQGATLIGIDPIRHASVTALPAEVEQGSYVFMTAPGRIPHFRRRPEAPADSTVALDRDVEAEALDPDPASEAPVPRDLDPASEAPVPRDLDPASEAPASEAPVPRDLSDDDDGGGWEDPAVEIPRLRAAGDLPPAATLVLPPDARIAPESPEPEPASEPLLAPASEPAMDALAEPEADGVLPPVLLGRELAVELGVGMGDPLQIITPVGRMTPQGMVPGMVLTRVAGVFFTGIFDIDRKHLYLPLDQAQAFQRAGFQVNAIDIKLHHVEAIDAGRSVVAAAVVGHELVVEDWRDQNRDLFAAMFLEKVAMFIALVFVILVAAFGILATNLMAVLEKAPEIAILKTMGCRDRELARTFALEGLCVGALGVFGGIAAGVALGLALGVHGLPIQGGVFYLERLPIRIDPAEVAVVAAIALAIVALSSAWPARSAARLRPVDGLRLRDE
jgi:lipoprotein-releasing system permease protein